MRFVWSIGRAARRVSDVGLEMRRTAAPLEASSTTGGSRSIMLGVRLATLFVAAATSCSSLCHTQNKPDIAIQMVSSNTTSPVDPSVARDRDGRISVVWTDARGGHENIWLSEKPVGGEWSEPVSLSYSDDAARFASVCYDSDRRLHVVWAQFVPVAGRDMWAWVLLYRSRDNGGGWTEPETVRASLATVPQIAVDSLGVVHIAFVDMPADDIVSYVARQPSGAWTAVRHLSSEYSSSRPAICVSAKGECMVVWVGTDRALSDGIEYACKDASGNWTPNGELLRVQSILGVPALIWTRSGPRMLYSATVNRSPLLLASYVAGQGWVSADTISRMTITSDMGIASDTTGSLVAVWYRIGQGIWLSREQDGWTETLVSNEHIPLGLIHVVAGPPDDVSLIWEESDYPVSEDVYCGQVTW